MRVTHSKTEASRCGVEKRVLYADFLGLAGPPELLIPQFCCFFCASSLDFTYSVGDVLYLQPEPLA